MPFSPSLQHGVLASLVLLLLFLLDHLRVRSDVTRLRAVSHQVNNGNGGILAYPHPTCGKTPTFIYGPSTLWEDTNIPRDTTRNMGARVYYTILFPPKCYPNYKAYGVDPMKMKQLSLLHRSWDYHALSSIVGHWQHTLPSGIKV